eukprot:TRINITY_DN1602_c0_g1_i2.p1 TRINITY_DN1602_c0_g1~~TRINITY_DN1602_c0_g1_i2.p1  ORF type:complete len:148 (+),score=26.80 TRINITY_DN1602_c0_g1_i2:55-444(+)
MTRTISSVVVVLVVLMTNILFIHAGQNLVIQYFSGAGNCQGKPKVLEYDTKMCNYFNGIGTWFTCDNSTGLVTVEQFEGMMKPFPNPCGGTKNLTTTITQGRCTSINDTEQVIMHCADERTIVPKMMIV